MVRAAHPAAPWRLCARVHVRVCGMLGWCGTRWGVGGWVTGAHSLSAALPCRHGPACSLRYFEWLVTLALLAHMHGGGGVGWWGGSSGPHSIPGSHWVAACSTCPFSPSLLCSVSQQHHCARVVRRFATAGQERAAGVVRWRACLGGDAQPKRSVCAWSVFL